MNSTVTSFGAALRQAREGLGLSTQDASLRTKIRGDYLRALEDGNLSALPERTFARSYLTRYARELGLDPQPLLSDFDRMMPAPAGSSYVTPALPERRPNRALWAAVGVAALLAVGGAAFVFTRSAPAPQEAATPAAAPTQPAPPAVRTVRLTVKVTPPGARVYLDNRDLGAAPIVAFPVDARQQAELRVELAGRQPLRQAIDVGRNRDLRVTLKPTGQTSVLSDAAQPAQPAPTSSAPNSSAPTSSVTAPDAPSAGTTPVETSPAKPQASQGVTVTYSGPSWTRVTDAAGRIVFEGTPAAGTVKTFAKGVTIRTGNAAAVRVSVNGGPGAPLGQSGQVVTRTF